MNASTIVLEKFHVVLRDGRDDGCSYRSVIVRAIRPAEAMAKATRTQAAKTHPHVCFYESAGHVAFELAEAQRDLEPASARRTFWCLVHDRSDDSFSGVYVAVAPHEEPAEAAIAARKLDYRLTQQGNCGFHVALTETLEERRALLNKLQGPAPKVSASLEPPATGREEYT